MLFSPSAYPMIKNCFGILQRGAHLASERFPIPGISAYSNKIGVSSESSTHVGGVYLTEVVLRKSDKRAVSHRSPLNVDADKIPEGESSSTVKAAAWESLEHQDQLLKRVHSRFKAKKKKIPPPLPRAYGFKRGKNNKKVWESDYVEGVSVLESLKNISKAKEKSPHQKLLEGLSLFERSCLALEALHANDVLHLDMKSANLIQSSNREITVIDLAGSLYRPKEAPPLIPQSLHYEKDYLPPEYKDIGNLRTSELRKIPYTFDYYTLAKSFHKKFFANQNPGDYEAHRRDPKLKKLQDFYKEYKTKIYDVLTSPDPKVREGFKIKDISDLISKYSNESLRD